MPTISDYLKYAETSFAAYASNLTLGRGNASEYENNADMAHTQAQRFDASWMVLGQQDLGDGFSAVLFQPVDDQGNPSGEKVLAIRGTEGSHWDQLDARHARVLEQAYGRSFQNPNADQAAAWQLTYERLAEGLYGSLLAQTHLKPYYEAIVWNHNEVTDRAFGKQELVKLKETIMMQPVNDALWRKAS